MNAPVLTLPTEYSEPVYELNRLVTLLYGLPKIGKTTWAAGAENALFLATEEGQNHVRVKKLAVTDWETFCQACKLIAAGNHDYKTIVIDTIDNLHEMCVNHFNRANNLTHENDMGYGKGYALIYREFIGAIRWLSLQPYGLIMISHARQMEVKTPTGVATKYTCSLPDSAKNSIKEGIYKMADLFLFAELEEIYDETGTQIIGYDRVVRTQPTTLYEAGDRTGRLPETLALDYEIFALYIQGDVVMEKNAEDETSATVDGPGNPDDPNDPAFDPYNHD